MERTVLGARALRELAARHGIRPSKALGQHFLADPNLGRAIVADAGVRPGDPVLEIGPGLGSLTVALLEAGAEVLAVEIDRRAVAALQEILPGSPRVRVLQGDALEVSWPDVLDDRPWKMVSNLPYNVAVPVVLELLQHAPQVELLQVMVQREVGERLAAGPGQDAYGAVSVRVAYHCRAEVTRRVPPGVFWPEPGVESVLVRLVRRAVPPVDTPPTELFRVVDEGFAQRRKTMRNALVRLGLAPRSAEGALRACGLDPLVRAESLGLDAFACLAAEVGDHG